MKRFFLFLAFALVATVSMQAQAKKSCAATCTKAKMAACSASSATTAKAAVPADAKYVNLGSGNDEQALNTAKKLGNIERVVDVDRKMAIYMRKDVCATSGKVSYTNVEYCTKTSKFLNVSPTATAKAAGCCTKGAAKSCQPGDKATGKATKASLKAGE